MQWYYSINGQRLGPIAAAEFERLIAEGTIKPETLVWTQGMKDWAPCAAARAAAEGASDDAAICAVSGRRYPKREMIQYEGQWISAEHRDEFFQRLREGVVAPQDFVYGNFLPRFCAKFIDGVIGFLLGVVFNMTVALLIFGSPNYLAQSIAHRGSRELLLFQVITTPLGIALGVAYAWFFISRYDATPGKMALGLKLLRPDGAKLSTGRIIGRHFAELISAMIFLIGYIMAGFDEERRTLHDRICDTRVIKAR